MARNFADFAPEDVSALSKGDAANYLSQMSADEINALPENILKALPAGTGELLKKSAIDVGELKVKTAINLGDFWPDPRKGF